MFFKQISVGGDRNFAYLIGDQKSKEAVAIDPSFSPDKILEEAQKNKLKIKYIINTHSHYDHINGNDKIKQKTGAMVMMHEYEPGKADMRLKDNQEIELGKLKLKVIHTPGHSPGGICILAENKLITGDTLFVGNIGTTEFEGGNAQDEWQSLKRLMDFDDKIEVYPGHNYGNKPSSTIGNERKNNPYIQCKDFKEFHFLKTHWDDYKKKHGLK